MVCRGIEPATTFPVFLSYLYSSSNGAISTDATGSNGIQINICINRHKLKGPRDVSIYVKIADRHSNQTQVTCVLKYGYWDRMKEETSTKLDKMKDTK